MKYLLIIYLAGAAPPDVKHPDSGFYSTKTACVTLMKKARAQGHHAKCIDLDVSGYRYKEEDQGHPTRSLIPGPCAFCGADPEFPAG